MDRAVTVFAPSGPSSFDKADPMCDAAVMIRQVCKNVSITPAMDRFISAQVASGRYQNASEVVRAAIRCLERDEAVETERRVRLTAAQQQTAR